MTGTVAAIEELLEASEAASASILSTASLKHLQEEVRRAAGNDPGVGDAQTRQSLGHLLQAQTDLTAHRVPWHSLRQLLDPIREGYLARWAASLRGPNPPRAERTARYVAGHLLSCGFSRGYLHRWLTYQTVHRPDPVTLPDLLIEAEADLVRRQAQTFEVVIPCQAAPLGETAGSAAWRDQAEIARLIEEIQGKRASIRQVGGFVLSISARDPDAAVGIALEQIARWTARLELATNRSLTIERHAWVVGQAEPVPTTRGRRGVEIGALLREDRIYNPSPSDDVGRRIDDALQLLQPLELGPRATAIGGGWAAIEALLLSAGEQPRDLAAGRIAAIVACSYPRAELTTLSYLHQREGADSLAGELADAQENLNRSKLVATAILSGGSVATRRPQDEAAVLRMAELLRDPMPVLRTVRMYVESAIRRLYRHRNLILHGGFVSGDGRDDALVTVPPLVGAGVDRIVHAYLTEGLDAVQLAARAELRLSLVGSAGDRTVADLLEP